MDLFLRILFALTFIGSWLWLWRFITKPVKPFFTDKERKEMLEIAYDCTSGTMEDKK